MTQAFRVGDVVSLKSGGLDMTVTKIQDDTRIATAWTDGVEQKRGVWQAEVLTKSTPA